MADTPQEKINKANDEYHEAVNEWLQLEDVNVKLKCQAADIFNRIFAEMEAIKKMIGDNNAG